jgi:thiosulfate dehydrogenase [quinone] large subunit
MTHLTSSLLLLRLSLGWYFLWAGLTKIFDPTWSAVGFLQNAKTFPDFYRWFASPEIVPWTNFLNEWGIALVGLSLLLGIAVRIGSTIGSLLMMLYYFPSLEFPFIPPHAFIVDEHVIYTFGLAVLAFGDAERKFGLRVFVDKIPFFKRHPLPKIFD